MEKRVMPRIMTTDDNRIQIMRVVEKLTTNRRFHEITLGEVARNANVGKGTIYYYFKNKDDLFFQVAASGFEELCELLRQKVPYNTSFSDKLSSVCKQITTFFAARRQLLQMMQSEADLIYWRRGRIRQQWLAGREMLIRVLADIFEEGIAEGTVRSDIPAEILAVFLLGMLKTRVIDLNNAPDSADKLLVDIFMNGLCLSADKLSFLQTTGR